MFILIILIAHSLMFLMFLTTKWLDHKDRLAQQKHEANLKFKNSINKIDSIDWN